MQPTFWPVRTIPPAAVKRMSDYCSSATPTVVAALTLVIERTFNPTPWLTATSWAVTERKRRILDLDAQKPLD